MMITESCTDKSVILSSEMYEIYRHCMYLPNPEKYLKRMTEYLSDKSILFYVCRENDMIIGMTVLRQTDSAVIEGIAVSRQARGRGAASNMIDTIRLTKNRTVLYAETDCDAVGFYEKYGFTVRKTVRHFDGGDAERYECVLTV